jgi:hypothetical protein
MNVMKYHAPTGQFTVSHKDLEHAARCMKAVIKHIRELSGKPLTKYVVDGPMEAPEFAQQRVIDIAKSIGIDLGSEWGHEIDVSD